MAGATNKTPNKRQERSARTRASILAAAERIFAESGLAGARTEAIVAAAKVNKALLYYYFKSKAGLYEAVIEDHFREFNEKAVALLSSPGSARSILLSYVSLHFDFISSRHRYAPLYQQIMFSDSKGFERLVRTYFLPRAESLGALLARGTREGEFRKTEIFHTAVSIHALILFFFSARRVLQIFGHLDAYSEANLKLRKQEVLEFIRHGLFADPHASLT